MAISEEDRKRIEQQVQAFRARKVKELSNPPAPRPDPEEALRAGLERTEIALALGDKRRIKALSRMADILIRRGDWVGARGAYMEVVHMCETAILGWGGAYPVVSTLPPPPRTGHSTLPALTSPPPEQDDEPP